MDSSTNPVARRRDGWLSALISIVLLIVGVVIDMMAVANVPGTVEFNVPEHGQVEFTSLGAGVGLLMFLSWGTVFWRVRRPLVTMIGGTVLALVGVSYVLLLIGAVSYASRRPRPGAVSGLAAGIVVLFAVREATTSWGAALPWLLGPYDVNQQEPAWVAATFVCALGSLGVAAGIVASTRARRRADRSDERAAEEHRRADELTEQMVRQAERERIARDMHDALAHRLSVVSLHAGALEAAADAGGAGEIARTVREQTHAALQDMRGLIGDLRTGPADASPPTMRGVRMLLADVRAGGAAIGSYVVLEAPERASAQLDTAVHRIVQEALTNALKHAPGAPVDVHVEVDPQHGARVRVVNPVRPDAVAAAIPGGGHGTLGIRERAAALGGTAWIGEYEGMFIVDVTLPWQERDAPPGP